MGTRDINDDHAADLTNVQEMHGVIDRLRQLYAATFDRTRDAAEPSESEGRLAFDDQSTTGR